MMKYSEMFKESKKDKFPNIKTIEIDGHQIIIGKDSKSNDYLTTIMANPDDLWFHCHGYPGSHILLKAKDNLPSNETIKKVAELAAKNSKAPNGDVPVIYCKQKFVKKEGGMNPGQVKVDKINSYKIIVSK